jgi:tetratricopeptide (TPR) repeat protein
VTGAGFLARKPLMRAVRWLSGTGKQTAPPKNQASTPNSNQPVDAKQTIYAHPVPQEATSFLQNARHCVNLHKKAVAHNHFKKAEKIRHEALRHFNLAIETAPHYVEAFEERAAFHQSHKNYLEALQDYSQAITLHVTQQRNPLRLYEQRGDIYYTLAQQAVKQRSAPDFQRHMGAAIEDYTTALNDITSETTTEQQASNFEKRGLAFRLRSKHPMPTHNSVDDLRRALQDYERATELQPENTVYTDNCNYLRQQLNHQV